MEQLCFGVSSMNLGKCAQKKPDRNIILQEWETAATVSSFYRAGGNPLPATPTQSRFLWDETNLYVLFICQEAARRAFWNHEDGREEGVWLKRSDCVEIAVSGRNSGFRDFVVFMAGSEGKTQAQFQKGMTYLGGDEAYRGGKDRIGNQAEITEIDKRRYFCNVKSCDSEWMAYFELPWELLGGLPEKQFRLQVYRKKFQTSEVSCPHPLDLNVNYSDRFEYDPLTFLEVYLGGECAVHVADSVLFALPDKTLRWQRPAALCWPTGEVRGEIAALQMDESPTEPETLEKRVYLAQRWQDTLTLEGMDFFFNQAIANPWEAREPWVERRVCNEYLRQGRTEDACKRLDLYLTYLRRITAWWYADHSLGNRNAEKWLRPECLTAIEQEDDTVIFVFRMKNGTLRLNCTASQNGFRFFTDRKGVFDGEKQSLRLVREKTSVRLVSEHGALAATMGNEWFLMEEESGFLLNRDNFSVLGEEKMEGFEICGKLAGADAVYGFGERFDAVNQRGKVLTLWQRDSCEGCLASIGNQSYKNIPLFHHSAGYSVFINSHYRIRADVGNERKDRLRLTAAGPILDFYVWPGGAKETLQNYAALTGKPILPPKWVFEPWAGGGAGRWANGPLKNLCREQMAVLERFAELDIPHSGFYAEGAGADFWGEDRREELYKIVNAAREKGIRTFSWQFPNMSLQSARKLLPGIADEDLPVTGVAGGEEKHELPRYIDFTHPKGMELLRAQWADRMDAGIRGTMVDFGDVVPDEAQFYDGRRGDEMHNGYALEYAKSYRKLFEECYGDDHVLFTRGAGAGSQAYACQFGGDHLASFLGMEYAIRGGLTAAASGLPFWGVDAGGYDGFGDEETYIRWTEYACFCPIMRYHGTAPREPWEYGDNAVAVYRFYAWLRENLLNYSYSAAVEAHKTGIPMMRPLLMEYPEENELTDCWDEYLYGPDLLVAPMHGEGNKRKVRFPKGRWVSLWDNRDISEGPKEREVLAPLHKIAVYLREGAFLPMELNGNLRPGYSMTTSRKQILMLAVSDTETGGKWYRSDTDFSEYKIGPVQDGYLIGCSGTEEIEYLILKGLTERPECIEINGVSFRQSPAGHALYFEEGWVEEPDGTVIIRLWKHGQLSVKVCVNREKTDRGSEREL